MCSSSDSDSDCYDFSTDVGKALSKDRIDFTKLSKKQEINSVVEARDAKSAINNNRYTRSILKSISTNDTIVVDDDKVNDKVYSEGILKPTCTNNTIVIDDDCNPSTSQSTVINNEDYGDVEIVDENQLCSCQSMARMKYTSDLTNKVLTYINVHTKQNGSRRNNRKRTVLPEMKMPNFPCTCKKESDIARQTALVHRKKMNEKRHLEDLNPEVTVNVMWRSHSAYPFNVRKYSKLGCIEDFFKKDFNVPSERLLFFYQDKPINLNNCSYAELQLNCSSVIEGHMVPETYRPGFHDVTSSIPTTTCAKGFLTFKIQTNAHRNNSFKINLAPSENVDILLIKVAEELDKPLTSIKLIFDGHAITTYDTLESLELEGGECFDLVIG